MLTITVNDCEEKLHIGCRTFVSLDELLNILEADGQDVSLNGEPIPRDDFVTTDVKGGDALKLN